MISAEILKAPYSGSNGDHVELSTEVISTIEVESQSILPLAKINMSTRSMGILERKVVFAKGPVWRGFVRIALATAIDPEKTFSLKDMDNIAMDVGLNSTNDFPGITLLRGVRRKIEEDPKSPQLFVTDGGWRDFSYQLQAGVKIIDKKPADVKIQQRPSKTIEDDMAVVSSVQSGNREDFGILYERFHDKVFRQCYYRAGENIAEAEDLTQRVFIKALRGIDGYRPQGKPFSAWLISIANNLLIEHYRAKKATDSIEDVILVAGDDTDPTLLAEKDLDNTQLYQAIKRLKPDWQRVVVARYMYEMEYEEIARMIKKSEGAVRVIVHRAILYLRALLKEEYLPNSSTV